MRRLICINLILVLFSILFSGCFATRQDVLNIKLEMQELRRDLTEKMDNNVNVNIEVRDEIIDEIETLKKISADLRFNVDNMSGSLNKIGGKVDDGNYRFKEVKGNQEYLENIDKKLSVIEDKLFKLLTSTNTIAAASPEQIYNMARSDYSRGNYDLAISGFLKLIENYPETVYAENSYYDVAAAYFVRKDWTKVCELIDTFAGKYPSNDSLIKAYLLKAKALKKLGNFEAAKDVYTNILKTYPSSEEAKTAKDELDYINNVKI